MQKNISRSLAVLATVTWAAIGLIVTGCSTSAPPPTAVAAGTPPAGSAGPQLWAQNCGHCHNLRSPSSYSDAKWDVAALHMRVRAKLTADEYRNILVFLKSAH